MSHFGTVKKTLDLLSSVVVVVAGGILLWNFTSTPTEQERISDASGLSIPASALTNVDGDGIIAVVEFSDYECPFCASQARDTFPEIQRGLIAKGAVQYSVLNFPLEQIHPLALEAGKAAECAAEQNRFWQMHNRLFEETPTLSQEDLRIYAADAGLDMSEFSRCIVDETTAEKIRFDQALGRELGVTATPTLFLGMVQDDGSIELVKRIRGIFSYAELEAELDKLR